MLNLRTTWLLPAFFMVLLGGCASKIPLNKAVTDSAPTDVTAAIPVEKTISSGADMTSSSTASAARQSNENVFYFDFDQDTINPEAYDALKAHAKFLAAHSNARIRLEGHTDERGTREYNLALGERRANAVAQFLGLNSVASEQIDAVSYGEEKPAALDHDESAWAQNRRVELIYTAGK